MNFKSMSLLNVLETGFVVLALLLFEPGELMDVLQGTDEVSEDTLQGGSQHTDSLERAIYLGVYGVTLFFIGLRSRRLFYVATRDKLLLVLVAIALLSAFWSFAPEVTLRRSFVLIGTVLFGIYLATRFSLNEQLRLLAWTLGIAALLSLLVALAFPSYGVMDSGEWQGIYRHKNALGRVVTLGGIIFLLRAVSNRRHRLTNYGGFGLSMGLLLLSNSQGAWVIFLTLLALLPLFHALRWTYTLAVPFFIAMVLAGGIVVSFLLSNAEPVLTALGKDTTLSGRTEIWRAVFEMIREHPWAGYGYGGFWLGWDGESANVWSSLPGDFFPAHSHNGFLDLWLDLGLLGLLVFAAGYFVTLLRAIPVARSTMTMATLWPLVYLTYMFLSNIGESSILKPNDLWWVLYVATVLSVAIERDRITKGHPLLQAPRLRRQDRVWSKNPS